MYPLEIHMLDPVVVLVSVLGNVGNTVSLPRTACALTVAKNN